MGSRMDRREFICTVTGLCGTILAGCSGGGTILRKRRISATSPQTEWEVDLEEGRELELAVTLESGMTVNGYLYRQEDGKEIVAVGSTSGTSREEFEVPTTGTYLVTIEVNGSTGTIILQEAV